MPEWKYFVLGRDKSPLPNCARCRESVHDFETCPCLVCHAFYAATSDPVRLAAMRERSPDGAWAVRTGAASGIIVLDAEGDGDPSGVDVLDDFESWTGGIALAHTDRLASTPSGGVHRYYEYVPGVRSRNRVLPGVDIKSDGGYVVVPGADNRRRWIAEGSLGAVTGDFRTWLAGARGHSTQGGLSGSAVRTVGYDYDAFLRDGCPDGCRDEFFNELAFRLRKAGVDRHTATLRIREQWNRAAQPPQARWYMPWHHVEYKIERIWRTVPTDEITPVERLWIAELMIRRMEPARIGRVTLAQPDGGA